MRDRLYEIYKNGKPVGTCDLFTYVEDLDHGTSFLQLTLAKLSEPLEEGDKVLVRQSNLTCGQRTLSKEPEGSGYVTRLF